MTEIECFQKLVALANQWLADSSLPDGNAYVPDPEADKVAKTRTRTCATQLLRVLAGEEPK